MLFIKSIGVSNHSFYFLIIFFLLPLFIGAQIQDTGFVQKDSIAIVDSISLHKATPSILLQYQNSDKQSPSIFFPENIRNKISTDILFYIICVLFLVLGIFRSLNKKYFDNITRVFFNNSLRQSQLIDQLLQTKIPSLFMNLFFVAVAGLYLFLLLSYFEKSPINNWINLYSCIFFVLLVYVVKYIILHFFGWITDSKSEVEKYSFLVFLFNKILGLLLLPFVVIMAFTDKKIASIFVTISFCMIVIVLLLRYFRAYNLLRNKLKLSWFHFLLYVIGLEILPILLIYKATMSFLNKSL